MHFKLTRSRCCNASWYVLVQCQGLGFVACLSMLWNACKSSHHNTFWPFNIHNPNCSYHSFFPNNAECELTRIMKLYVHLKYLNERHYCLVDWRVGCNKISKRAHLLLSFRNKSATNVPLIIKIHSIIQCIVPPRKEEGLFGGWTSWLLA